MSQQKTSGQNQMEFNEETENQVAEVGENQVADAGEVVPNIEPHSAAFKMDADCWDEVFDYLSLEDVYSFGRTCKAFQRITGKYFQWKYESAAAIYKSDGIYINGKRMNGFSKFVNSILFAFSPNSITSHFETVKKIAFCSYCLSHLQFKLIENFLSKVEILELFFYSFDQHLSEAIIRSCVNLKRLKIEPIHPTIHQFQFFWSIHSHPTLQQLILYADQTSKNNKLTTFIEQSPNLRSLAIPFSLLWNSRHSFPESKIKLVDFAIDMWRVSDDNLNFDDIIGILNDLHQRHFYKRLHLKSYKFPEHKQLMALPGLVTLFAGYGKNTNFGPLDNITELGIYDDFNISDIATNFTNLKQLYFPLPTIDDLLPFIRYSIKLKLVELRYIKGKFLDICALNNERRKLHGARKVTIYVDEHVYLATKWAMKETIHDLIEVKRNESKLLD